MIHVCEGQRKTRVSSFTSLCLIPLKEDLPLYPPPQSKLNILARLTDQGTLRTHFFLTTNFGVIGMCGHAQPFTWMPGMSTQDLTVRSHAH